MRFTATRSTIRPPPVSKIPLMPHIDFLNSRGDVNRSCHRSTAEAFVHLRVPANHRFHREFLAHAADRPAGKLFPQLRSDLKATKQFGEPPEIAYWKQQSGFAVHHYFRVS